MHVFLSQVRKRISVCHRSLAVRIPAHARTQWCAVVTEGCVPCLRVSLKIQPNCEFLLLTPFIFIHFGTELDWWILSPQSSHNVTSSFLFLLGQFSSLKKIILLIINPNDLRHADGDSIQCWTD